MISAKVHPNNIYYHVLKRSLLKITVRGTRGTYDQPTCIVWISKQRTNIFKSALNKKVTFFNRPWIWFKADWFRADWIRYQRLHVEWSIVIKISEKHFVCPFISWKALKMGLSSIFPLRNQSALNQSVLNQIQGWLKIVTLLFKTDLKIFLHSIIHLPYWIQTPPACECSYSPPRIRRYWTNLRWRPQQCSIWTNKQMEKCLIH